MKLFKRNREYRTLSMTTCLVSPWTPAHFHSSVVLGWDLQTCTHAWGTQIDNKKEKKNLALKYTASRASLRREKNTWTVDKEKKKQIYHWPWGLPKPDSRKPEPQSTLGTECAAVVQCELFRGKINLQNGPWNSAGVCNMSGSLAPRPREDQNGSGRGHCGPGSLSLIDGGVSVPTKARAPASRRQEEGKPSGEEWKRHDKPYKSQLYHSHTQSLALADERDAAGKRPSTESGWSVFEGSESISPSDDHVAQDETAEKKNIFRMSRLELGTSVVWLFLGGGGAFWFSFYGLFKWWSTKLFFFLLATNSGRGYFISACR